MDRSIVKVQRSLMSVGAMLVYDQNHTIFYKGHLTPEISAFLDHRPKAYCYATLEPDGILRLEDEATQQDW